MLRSFPEYVPRVHRRSVEAPEPGHTNQRSVDSLAKALMSVLARAPEGSANQSPGIASSPGGGNGGAQLSFSRDHALLRTGDSAGTHRITCWMC